MHARLLAAATASLLALSFGATSAAMQRDSGAALSEGLRVVLQDDESARVRQAITQQPTFSRPAPRVWSSRLEIRWTARWESAPRYAV